PVILKSSFFSRSLDHQHLHSFPTRRSSDLAWQRKAEHAILQNNDAAARNALSRYNEIIKQAQRYQQQQQEQEQLVSTMKSVLQRSEEHTSELQSRSDLVCRLLLEKKKKNKK